MLTDKDLFELVALREYEKELEIEEKMRRPGYIPTSSEEANDVLQQYIKNNPGTIVFSDTPDPPA